MYDNISVKQSGKDLGRILKTSPDLSTVAVIANARQGKNVSLLWAAPSGTDPVTLRGKRIASHNFQGKKVTAAFTMQVQPNHPPTLSVDNKSKLHIISFLKRHSAFRSQTEPGFIFFTLRSVSRGLNLMALWQQIHSSHFISPLLQPVAATLWQRQIREEIRET